LRICRLNAQELAQLARFRHDEPAQHATVAPAATRAERFADSVTAAVGSWRFLIARSIVFTAWIVLNIMGWRSAWDPYLFILC
jgi:uncharacterized membrane protein